MGIKAKIKGVLPDTVIEDISDYKRMNISRNHSQMSREQIEEWLCDSYRTRIGASLDLKNPVRYTEKIQWCKLNSMDVTKSVLSDKFAVREWVAEKIGEDYLVPLLGRWGSPLDIDFSKLPNKFVLKTNNASGTNIIVNDKSALDEKRVVKRLRNWLNTEFGWLMFEPQYLRIEPQVIAEQFICNARGSEIEDYKILCFDGEPRYVWVDIDRHTRHSRIVFDTDWNVQPWNQYYPDCLQILEKPQSLAQMINLARILAEGFAQVRVDFYIVDNRPLFGEMTFTNGSGFEEIRPDSWDYKLGSMWNLEKEPRAYFEPKDYQK